MLLDSYLTSFFLKTKPYHHTIYSFPIWTPSMNPGVASAVRAPILSVYIAYHILTTFKKVFHNYCFVLQKVQKMIWWKVYRIRKMRKRQHLKIVSHDLQAGKKQEEKKWGVVRNQRNRAEWQGREASTIFNIFWSVCTASGRRYRDTTCKVVWLLFFFLEQSRFLVLCLESKKKSASIMACKCSNFCSAHSPSPSFCLSAELLFHPHGARVLAKLSVQVPSLLLSKIPSPQDWAQGLVSPGSPVSPAPNRSQELMAAIFLTLRERLLRDVMRRAEDCGNQRQSLGLRCSTSL